MAVINDLLINDNIRLLTMHDRAFDNVLRAEDDLYQAITDIHGEPSACVWAGAAAADKFEGII